MVDFEKTKSVESVKIWNRSDSKQNRLDGFEVWIGDDPRPPKNVDQQNTKCFTGGVAPLAAPFTAMVDCVGTGRYLFIAFPERKTDNVLTLCEVEVYGGLGCDGVPNSGKVKDACNVCGGDGSSCAGQAPFALCLDSHILHQDPRTHII